MRRAALYLRVSTDEQTTANQRPELVRMQRARKLGLFAVYQESISGAAAKRPEFERMMADARRGAFNVLFVWALDRLGRSMHSTIGTVLELERLGVELVSAREPWLDTSGPVRPLLVSIFAWVAQQERARLSERTRAGMTRARAQGKRIGRPRRVLKLELPPLLALRAKGLSFRKIAQRVKVPEATVRRALGRA